MKGNQEERRARTVSLRWSLLATIGGIQFAAACGGKMTHDPLRDGMGGQAGANSGANPAEHAGGAATPANDFPCTTLSQFSSNLVSCNGVFVHRPGAASCALPDHDGSVVAPEGMGGRPSGGITTKSIAPCKMDSDCPQDTYCVAEMSGGVCVSACTADSDCAPHEVCACNSYLRQYDSIAIELGYCAPADCRTDADCASGFLCIVPLDSGLGCPWGPSKFTCQTESDECAGTADCPIGTVCSSSSPHRCQPGAACGRPFLVDGCARRAPEIASAGWLDHELAATRPGALDAATSRAVADHWLEAAAMEHASVAAFARFSLELMALGAPASLVESATLAMAEETRHARACYSLAARYSGRPRGPGALDVGGALGSVSLPAVVERAVLEGCIAETVAALEASWAFDAATDPVVRTTLTRIAEDEARHAALAFEFVRWAAERDARVLGIVGSLITEAANQGEPDRAADTCTKEALVAHGVLDSQARAEARHAAVQDILPALWRALSEGPAVPSAA